MHEKTAIHAVHLKDSCSNGYTVRKIRNARRRVCGEVWVVSSGLYSCSSLTESWAMIGEKAVVAGKMDESELEMDDFT